MPPQRLNDQGSRFKPVAPSPLSNGPISAMKRGRWEDGRIIPRRASAAAGCEPNAARLTQPPTGVVTAAILATLRRHCVTEVTSI